MKQLSSSVLSTFFLAEEDIPEISKYERNIGSNIRLTKPTFNIVSSYEQYADLCATATSSDIFIINSRDGKSSVYIKNYTIEPNEHNLLETPTINVLSSYDQYIELSASATSSDIYVVKDSEINALNKRITNVGIPQQGTDALTKAYGDNMYVLQNTLSNIEFDGYSELSNMEIPAMISTLSEYLKTIIAALGGNAAKS